jgi:hypothetical protein
VIERREKPIESSDKSSRIKTNLALFEQTSISDAFVLFSHYEQAVGKYLAMCSVCSTSMPMVNSCSWSISWCSGSAVRIPLWVSLFALITSPHPGVKGVPSRQKDILVCVVCSTDLELQLGCMFPRELSRSFERTGQLLKCVLSGDLISGYCATCI